ncbi:hypothetical protein ACFVVM_03190 [Nocardia sp. NPDC058176]|uniref:hypothetical protein n=1 Tax=Nocardia sp. NPDC058176 TaxID=3346368 RepID=UPI0036DCB626
MAIAKKGRRRIVVGDREFLWWVRPDWDNHNAPGVATVTVATDDRRILLDYALNQDEDSQHVTVLGPEFRGESQNGPARRFRCPKFGLPGEIRPSHVAELIAWCTDPGPLPEPTDWRGHTITAART